MAQLEQNEFRERMDRIGSLVQEIEGIAAPVAQVAAKTLLQTVLDLYGAGLERIFEVIYQSDQGGQALIDELAQDELVSSILLLHGLHPFSLETRVRLALDKVRPYLGSHGGNVELVGLEDGFVRLRLQGSCDGCPSSAMTLELAIEEALQQYAPDINGLKVEGVVAAPAVPANFVPLSQLKPPAKKSLASVAGPWQSVGVLPPLDAHTPGTVSLGDIQVLFCRLNETLYAYNNRCPSCGSGLDLARLAGPALTCPTCGHSYDVMRAGRDLDQPSLHLDPLPLLEENGQAKVALPVR